jgi:hypothetical protein
VKIDLTQARATVKELTEELEALDGTDVLERPSRVSRRENSHTSRTPLRLAHLGDRVWWRSWRSTTTSSSGTARRREATTDVNPDTESLVLDVADRLERAVIERDCPAMVALQGDRTLVLSDYDYLRDEPTAAAFEQRAAEKARENHTARFVFAVPQVWVDTGDAVRPERCPTTRCARANVK